MFFAFILVVCFSGILFLCYVIVGVGRLMNGILIFRFLFVSIVKVLKRSLKVGGMIRFLVIIGIFSCLGLLMFFLF